METEKICTAPSLLRMPLLKAVVIQANCVTLPELRKLSGDRAIELARALKKLRANSAPLHEWNNTLTCVTGAPPEQTQKAAKERLIAILSKREGR